MPEENAYEHIGTFKDTSKPGEMTQIYRCVQCHGLVNHESLDKHLVWHKTLRMSLIMGGIDI